LALAATVYLYFATGTAAVATWASPMPFEKKFARTAQHARLEAELYAKEFPGKEQTAVAKGECPRPPHPSEARGD
jgi:hypothetical protein